ncbi:MAG: archaeosortase/exosortase family protein, partial [Verrucomicrobiota bacterium]
CSGIRSTLVLLIVSVLTGYFFLRSPGKRTLLVAVTIPLALARNGFRIWVIGEMCVRLGPEMIDSFIHRRGGPIFFALSLIPLFIFLILLQRKERRTFSS